tara:strand:- start:730 stop:4530 length:3801 start_codon:yes stop_codon:yes gene_type:complete
MTTIFNKVHGFNLKLPLNNNSRQYPDNYGEWIEIIKKPNQLPTVKLKTVVLYYRNNGDVTNFNSNNFQNIPSGESGGNYRFYNDSGDCSGQMGWIWGFPLFDVSGSSGNWPKFESCIGDDISGNEKMLVSLKEQKNIIVLDCSGLQPTDGSGCKDISNNITDLTGNFFMTLRIKKSVETDFYDFNFQDYGSGNRGNWNLWDDNIKQYTQWASLVQYEYECDIIGPTGMLDFTFDYFMINDSGISRPIYQNYLPKNYLAIPNNLSNFNSSRESSCKIITGLQTGIANDVEKRMDITNILKNLSSIVGGPKRLEVKENWNQTSSSTVVKLIGGWYSYNSTTDLSNCYYGDNIGVGDFKTNMSTTAMSHKTEGWKNFIKLATSGTNDWSTNTFDSTYELNNILWCSLQSPRKIPVRKLGGGNNLKRYITNWIDLSGGNSSNKIIAGGYGRYKNTIDMARQSYKPYYSSAANDNTYDIPDFVINQSCYFDSSDNILSINDLNYFRVYYKLLIPLDGEFTISFTTGKENNSVSTFFRHAGMDGTCNPTGKTNRSAYRDKETITLKWDADSINPETYDISTQSIYFTDIASGFSKIDASFNCTDNSLNYIVTDMSKNYDINFNVFQLHFLSKSGENINTTRNEIPYTIKSFNNNDPEPQNIDISFVPQNYEPYRYINYNKTKFGDSIEKNYYFDDDNNQIKIITEELVYNPAKSFVKNTVLNAEIIDPVNKYYINPEIIDICGTTINSRFFSVKKSNGYVQKTDPEDIFILTSGKNVDAIPSGITQITNKNPELHVVTSSTNNFNIIFYAPSSLKLGDNLIPDFWRLPDKINTLNTLSLNDVTNNEYNYFNTWENQIQVSMLCDILSLSLKHYSDGIVRETVTHILINSVEGSSQLSAFDTDGEMVPDNSQLIFDVQGALGVKPEDYLNKSPIIIELSTTVTGPFGLSGKAFIGNKNGYSGNGSGPKDGINVPYPAQNNIPSNSNKYVVDTILTDKFRKGNGPNNQNAAQSTSGPYNKSYNGEFDVNLSAWDNENNNAAYQSTNMSPSPLKVLLIELPNIHQLKGTNFEMVNNSNTAVTIKWNSFYFSKDIDWDKKRSDVFWTISRLSVTKRITTIILLETPLNLNGDDEYEFVDRNVTVYDKLVYTVTGKFKWFPSSQNPQSFTYLNVPGFVTQECFVCKNNRFEYGRFNTSSTNLKLYRPLLINTPAGQEFPIGNRVCGGGCGVDERGFNLYNPGSRISSSNNIYSNTTNQLSKKQTYVLLSKSRFRPDR